MKIQFVKDNGEVIETTVTDLSVWLFDDSISRSNILHRLYDFVEEKEQQVDDPR